MKPRYANVTRNLILFSLFLFVFHGTVFASDLSSTANIFMYPKPFKIADLRLQSPSGQTVSLADFKGKVVCFISGRYNVQPAEWKSLFSKRSRGASGRPASKFYG